MNKTTKIFIAFFVVIILAGATKKNNKPYHSSVYSSWEEEQLDEMRADLNYIDEQLEKINNRRLI